MPDPASKALFLSYASQDAEAAQRIADALRSASIEVWFDRSELVGGDAWDQKIRAQITGCALFVPVISANSNARGEGYFRLEWKLAVDRSHLMAHDQPFLLPVVIDETTDAAARVPPEFRAVQWTRLSDGVAHAPFCARVQRLLLDSPLDADRSGSTARGQGAGSPTPPRARRLAAGGLAALIVAASLVAVVIQRSKPDAGAAAGPPAGETSAALTEAQQLVAKARSVFDAGDDMRRETYTLAEELLTRAEKLDPGEVSAWALHVRLSMLRYTYGLDRNNARKEALRAQADRVARLAPGSLEAKLADVYARYVFEQFAAAESELSDLVSLFPNDWRVHQARGRNFVRLGKSSDAIGSYNRALQLLPDDPGLKADCVNAYYSGEQFAEAQDFLTKALRGRTSGRLLCFEVFFQMIWSGDLTAEAKTVDRWPPWLRQEDRGAATAVLAALWNRDPARALDLLRQFPRDYLRDFMFTGPRAVLSALAHELAGHAASAQAEWRIVLLVTERELKDTPDDLMALHWRAWALAKVGETSAGAEIFRQLGESQPNLNGGLNSLSHVAGGFGGLALALGRKDEALVQIARVKTIPALSVRAITRTILRQNPVFDPLREDARFQALMAAVPGPDEKTP